METTQSRQINVREYEQPEWVSIILEIINKTRRKDKQNEAIAS